jgi:predicted transcriptional regulator
MTLKEILNIHRGRKRAITAKELSERLNMDERFVRNQIRSLIAEGIPIASSVTKPYGYFIVETLAEASEYAQSLRERLIEDALRRRDFKRAVAKSFDGSGQLKMF